MQLISNIWGDSQRYLQILNNFLSNSIKFTPDYGQVRVLIKVVDHQLVEEINSRRDAVIRHHSEVIPIIPG